MNLTENIFNLLNFENLMFGLSFLSIMTVLIITFINIINPKNFLKNYRNEIYDFNKHSDKDIQNKLPFVSVLVPARNEERNILNLLNSISNQNYPNYELIILNDNSTDNTAKIVSEFIANNSHINIQLIIGRELPSGWIGKNWACFQLSESANGDILIYTDADNTHSKDAIITSVNVINRNNVDFLSAFPEQILVTFWEKVITPFIDLVLYSLLPLILVKNSKFTSLSAANGQWIVIAKDAYKITGGHNTLKNKIVEDVEFCKLIKSKNLKAMVLNGQEIIFTRMYHNLTEIISGFNKNFYGLTNNNIFIFLFLMTFFTLLGILPFVYLFCFALNYVIILTLLLLLWQILLSLMIKQNKITEILFQFITLPIKLIFVFIIGIKSMYSNYSGNITWKDRKVKL
jgi:cellulose synthase/poly-beta-1,6-N-acetylglucosamine synthase-like glycosyltransferase